MVFYFKSYNEFVESLFQLLYSLRLECIQTMALREALGLITLTPYSKSGLSELVLRGDLWLTIC
jgi:hypothetical protein